MKFWRLGWETDPPVERMRRFYLVRTTDVSGVSGTGRVVAGVQFADGTVVMRWLTEHRSTVVWSDLASALTVHGHDGATVIEWVDG